MTKKNIEPSKWEWLMVPIIMLAMLLMAALLLIAWPFTTILHHFMGGKKMQEEVREADQKGGQDDNRMMVVNLCGDMFNVPANVHPYYEESLSSDKEMRAWKRRKAKRK